MHRHPRFAARCGALHAALPLHLLLPAHACRVSATGAALFQAAAWALPPYASRSSLLSPRSHSLEVLSLGLEQSTPYLPTKRSMLMQRQASTAALAPLSGRALAVQRWQRACQAVADARDVLRCLDLLANRLAPAEDRLHAAFLLRMRVDAYPSPERLACKLLARRGASRMPWTTHMVNELYITGVRMGCGRGDGEAGRGRCERANGAHTCHPLHFARQHGCPLLFGAVSSCGPEVLRTPHGSAAALAACGHAPTTAKSKCLLHFCYPTAPTCMTPMQGCTCTPAGERIFSFFVPPSMGEHRPYVTLTLVSVLVLVYFFMAGQVGRLPAGAPGIATRAC